MKMLGLTPNFGENIEFNT